MVKILYQYQNINARQFYSVVNTCNLIVLSKTQTFNSYNNCEYSINFAELPMLVKNLIRHTLIKNKLFVSLSALIEF